jgi:mRNA-degrading endonuclease toxin of MazEF toxin-antitoxin module
MTVPSKEDPRRGDLWWVTLDERRPIVILSTHGADVRAIVVVPPFGGQPPSFQEPLSSTAAWEEIRIGAEEGLTCEGVARVAFYLPGVTLCQWLVTLPASDLQERVGALSTSKLAQLERMLCRAGLSAG